SAAVRLQNAYAALRALHLRIGAGQIAGVQQLKGRSALAEDLLRAGDVRIVRSSGPEYAGPVEQRLLRAGRKLQPILQRALRRSGVDLVASVAHADDSGFPSRARTAVPCPVGVDKDHLQARACQVPRAPGPENSCADHGHIGAVHRLRPNTSVRWRAVI